METIPRSQNHLAELLGISKGAASKQAGRGMPTHSLEAAQAWRKAHLDPARVKGTRYDQYRKPRQPVQPLPAQEPTAPEPAGHDFSFHRTRLMVADANLAELREAEIRGELIRVDAVGKSLAVALATASDALLQIPARMGPVLAAEKEPQRVEEKLHEEIHRTMLTLSAMLARANAVAG